MPSRIVSVTSSNSCILATVAFFNLTQEITSNSGELGSAVVSSCLDVKAWCGNPITFNLFGLLTPALQNIRKIWLHQFGKRYSQGYMTTIESVLLFH